MVAGGYTYDAYQRVQIIDLEMLSTYCENLRDLPQGLYSGSGETLPDGSPLVCGGVKSGADSEECYTYENKEWKNFPSLTKAKHGIEVAKSPFVQRDFKLITVGGYHQGGIKTVEVLTGDGWRPDILPELPVNTVGHCVLRYDSRTLFVIGPSKTFFMSDDLTWIEGPPLNSPRHFSSCGRILRSDGSNEFSIISVGGVDSNIVEVLDAGSSEWRFGPKLPYVIGRAEMVEDTVGGVILIGGESLNGKGILNYLSIFQLWLFICILTVSKICPITGEKFPQCLRQCVHFLLFYSSTS